MQHSKRNGTRSMVEEVRMGPKKEKEDKSQTNEPNIGREKI